jgi:MFS transporter, PPP family, 3-phenylpropionic acid transporter
VFDDGCRRRLGYLLVHGLVGSLAVSLLQAATLAAIVPLSDALATTAAHESEARPSARFEYGWLRASGSAAFVIGTALSGWGAGLAGLPIIIWLSGGLLAVSGFAALHLPALPAAPARSAKARGTVFRDWSVLLKNAAFRRVLIVAAMVEGSHALHDSFSVIRWQAAGIGLSAVGALWSEAVLSEVVVFLFIGPRMVTMLTPGGACALAATAGALRWTVSAFTTSPLALAILQPLHGFTFALLHLACMRIIVLAVPSRLAATAQSVYGTFCIGLITALLTLIAGLLYQLWGGIAFLAMAALCLTALPACIGLTAKAQTVDQD